MFELRLLCPEERVEPVSDALEALDALSVSVEDADARTPAEQALFGEPGMPPPKEGWQRSVVIALFDEETQANEAAQLLSVQDFFADCKLLGVDSVPDQDWVRLTQSQFEPVEITPSFWIVPPWHEPPAQATRVIRLDPGMAFGTGTHPTTRMCLGWIARHAREYLDAVRDHFLHNIALHRVSKRSDAPLHLAVRGEQACLIRDPNGVMIELNYEAAKEKA